MGSLKDMVERKIQRPLGEAIGIRRWVRRPALHDLDNRLAAYLNFRGGTFVEAGANDGFNQSNTFFLEKGLRWRGVLVEAIPELYAKCREIRKRSKVFYGGLVSRDYPDPTLRLHYANLMSIAEGAMDADKMAAHIKLGLELQSIESSHCVDVPAITFEHVLTEAGLTHVDFLSLDLEGYELQALAGWNFQRIRPTYILIEVRDLNAVDTFMQNCAYRRVDRLTPYDHLYQDTQG